eukprot:6189794-Prymnesium_polylepis.2
MYISYGWIIREPIDSWRSRLKKATRNRTPPQTSAQKLRRLMDTKASRRSLGWFERIAALSDANGGRLRRISER